jgi:pantothenate kinase
VETLPSFADLVARAAALVPDEGRAVLGVAGLPGVGKTTLGLRPVKGHPDTFDAWGYAALLARLRRDTSDVVYAPGFERGLEQPVAGAVPVPATARLVVTEGNYLLLPGPAWSSARGELAETWLVETDDELRVRRLIARHVEFGKSPAYAEEWVARSDEANARLVREAGVPPDLVVSLR